MKRGGGRIKALGFRGIEASQKRKRGRSSSVFVCVYGVHAFKRQ